MMTTEQIAEYNRRASEEFQEFFSARALSSPLKRRVLTRRGPESISDAFVTDGKIYLIGDAGEGKSTTITTTAKEIADGKVPGLKTVFMAPLYRGARTDLSSHTAIIRLLQQTRSAASIPEEFVRERLHATDNAVIFDGLDELSSAHDRARFNTGLASLMEAYPETKQVMASTRPLEELDLRHANFQRYRFAPLEEGEVTHLLRAELSVLFSRFSENHRERKIVEVLADFERTKKDVEGYSHWLRNPTYLRLAALLDGYLPKTASKFLDDGMQRYLSYAKEDKGRVFADKKHEGKMLTIGQMTTDMEPVLAEIAYACHEEGRREMALSEMRSLRSWNSVRQWNTGGDMGDGVKISVSDEEKKEIIDLLAKTMPFFGLSHTDEDRHYYFTHLGIQEYFVGKSLANQLQIDIPVDQQLGNKLGDSWWRQALVYASGHEFWGSKIFACIVSTADQKFIADAYIMGKGKIFGKLIDVGEKAIAEIYPK